MLSEYIYGHLKLLLAINNRQLIHICARTYVCKFMEGLTMRKVLEGQTSEHLTATYSRTYFIRTQETTAINFRLRVLYDFL